MLSLFEIKQFLSLSPQLPIPSQPRTHTYPLCLKSFSTEGWKGRVCIINCAEHINVMYLCDLYSLPLVFPSLALDLNTVRKVDCLQAKSTGYRGL